MENDINIGNTNNIIKDNHQYNEAVIKIIEFFDGKIYDQYINKIFFKLTEFNKNNCFNKNIIIESRKNFIDVIQFLEFVILKKINNLNVYFESYNNQEYLTEKIDLNTELNFSSELLLFKNIYKKINDFFDDIEKNLKIGSFKELFTFNQKINEILLTQIKDDLEYEINLIKEVNTLMKNISNIKESIKSSFFQLDECIIKNYICNDIFVNKKLDLINNKVNKRFMEISARVCLNNIKRK